jgi:CheY-like chemotaxis protein
MAGMEAWNYNVSSTRSTPGFPLFSSPDDDQRQAMQAGAVAFLQKPVSGEAFKVETFTPYNSQNHTKEIYLFGQYTLAW